MKKVVSMALAASMVASLTAVAFAKVDDTEKIYQVGKTPYLEKDGEVNKAYEDLVGYGKTVYYPVYAKGFVIDTQAPDAKLVTKLDAIKGTSIKTKWEMNAAAVDKVEFVKKKMGPDSPIDKGEYGYFLSVKLKPSSSLSQVDVIGQVTIKKSSNNVLADGKDQLLDVNLRVGYAYADRQKVGDEGNGMNKTVDDTVRIYNFKEFKADPPTTIEDSQKLGVDDEDEITLQGVGYMTVDTNGQGKILLGIDTKFDADIAAKFPEANLDFVNGNGATFNKTGELTIEHDKGYIYQVKDGVITPVKAEYDEYEEAFKVKTRTLGQYIISDVELNLTTAPSESTSEPTSEGDSSTGGSTVVNPPSGAIA